MINSFSNLRERNCEANYVSSYNNTKVDSKLAKVNASKISLLYSNPNNHANPSQNSFYKKNINYRKRNITLCSYRNDRNKVKSVNEKKAQFNLNISLPYNIKNPKPCLLDKIDILNKRETRNQRFYHPEFSSNVYSFRVNSKKQTYEELNKIINKKITKIPRKTNHLPHIFSNKSNRKSKENAISKIRKTHIGIEKNILKKKDRNITDIFFYNQLKEDLKQIKPTKMNKNIIISSVAISPKLQVNKLELQSVQRVESQNYNHSVSHYILGEILGKGAYATVREAFDEFTKEKVAIKIYEKMKLIDVHRKSSVLKEIEILKKLNHPNIVKVLETFDTPNNLFVVMELVKGESLTNFLKRKKNNCLAEQEARPIFKQIVSGILYCHNFNISHRDIKLDNILIDYKSNIKIIDFGFSSMNLPNKKLKVFCGTPSYMAPEIVKRIEYYGPPADIWALGVLLFIILTGSFPFKAQTDKDLFKLISGGIISIPSFISSDAKLLISRMITIEPWKRPTISEVLIIRYLMIPL